MHKHTHKHIIYISLQDSRDGTTGMVTDAGDAEKRGHAQEIVDKTNAMLTDLKTGRNSNVVYVDFK